MNIEKMFEGKGGYVFVSPKHTDGEIADIVRYAMAMQRQLYRSEGDIS